MSANGTSLWASQPSQSKRFTRGFLVVIERGGKLADEIQRGKELDDVTLLREDERRASVGVSGRSAKRVPDSPRPAWSSREQAMSQSFFSTIQGWLKSQFGPDYGGRYIGLLIQSQSELNRATSRRQV